MNLSIIIPIYNTPVEKLQRCLQSIQRIRSKEYECILVDDGSMEDISNYLREYARNVPEFKYIYKENGGVSSARNLGMKNSCGKYLCFVDSDDEIEPITFDCFLSDEKGADIIFTYMKQDGNNKIIGKIADGEIEVSYEEMLQLILERKAIWGPVCKFIKNDFIRNKGIYFNTNMVAAEDLVFFLDMLMEKPIMLYLNLLSYYYHYDSVTGISRIKKHKALFYDNSLIFYKKFLQSLNAGQFGQVEFEKLKREAVKEFINGIFRNTLDMMEMGVDFKTIEENLTKTIKCVDVSRSDPIIKIKYYLLVGKRRRMLKMLAVIRKNI